ncbi:MAG: DnaA regulatory inactivator Hda [Quisquiliibacterium sp.]
MPLSPQRQLALDLQLQAGASLANFVPGRNLECLGILAGIEAGKREHRFVYLWGAQGSGRSHLLRALASDAQVLGPTSALDAFAFDQSCELYLVDDIERFDEARQHALFHLYNQVQVSPGAALVCCGAKPPLALKVREDLRTRLGWGLIFELHLLDDHDKTRALYAMAQERGVALAADVLPWLLSHRPRDIRSLVAEFDELDRFALARKRPITLALVREWLADNTPPDPTPPDFQRPADR